MDKQISWVLVCDIGDGQLEALRALMDEMVASTADESGALSYEWFLNADETSASIYERYADPAATLVHLGNFGEKFAERFLAILEPTSFNVYGEADDQVREALEPFGAQHHATFGGFVR